MDASCTNCGTRIMRRCGYTLTIYSVQVDKSFCTLKCVAEWAGMTNMKMQEDFTNDVRVDLKEREDPDAI